MSTRHAAAVRQTVQRGGLFLEDFQPGMLIEHGLRRTVTQADNTFFSCLTLNPQPLHIDAEFCASETDWGRPLINSFFTLGLVVGISVNDTTVGTTVGNLGMSEVRFPAPLFDGDTVRVTTEVLAVRESRSRPEVGIVSLCHRGYKQSGELIAECHRQAMIYKRGRMPADQK